jgi:predicted RNA-binding Zn-ribbon protein involved in translation (DUF1610 family)
MGNNNFDKVCPSGNTIVHMAEKYDSFAYPRDFEPEEADMKCPRCQENMLAEEKALNALSRRDNKTYICSRCGEREAIFDYEIEKMKEIESAWLKEVK